MRGVKSDHVRIVRVCAGTCGAQRRRRAQEEEEDAAAEGVVIQFQVRVPATAIIAEADALQPDAPTEAVVAAATSQLRAAMSKPAADAASFASLLADELTDAGDAAAAVQDVRAARQGGQGKCALPIAIVHRAGPQARRTLRAAAARRLEAAEPGAAGGEAAEAAAGGGARPDVADARAGGIRRRARATDGVS